MYRNARESAGRRPGGAPLAVLLSAGLTWAATLEESIGRNCDVTVVGTGESTIEFVGGNGELEEWIEFSIGLDEEGNVSIDGQLHGMIDMRAFMRFEIGLHDGVASITIYDDDTNELLWMHDCAYESVHTVVAHGDVESLDVE